MYPIKTVSVKTVIVTQYVRVVEYYNKTATRLDQFNIRQI